MSFILDALKKSERERASRSAVQAVPSLQLESERRRVWPRIAFGALLLNAIGLVALLWFTDIGLTPAEADRTPSRQTAQAPESEAVEPKAVPAPAEAEPKAVSAPVPEETKAASASGETIAASPPNEPPAVPASLPERSKAPQPPPEETKAATAPVPEKTTTALETAPPGTRVFHPPSRKPAPPARALAAAVATPARPPNPKMNASDFIKRGQAFEEEGLFARAIEEYTEAILLDPDSADAYFLRGWAHVAKGGHDLAIRDYSQAIRKKPRYAEAYFGRGWVYEQLDKDDMAIREYDQAIRLKPNYSEARFSRGILNFYGDQLAVAANDFSSVLADADDSLRLYALLWLYLSRVRSGANGDRTLMESAGNLGLDEWPGVIVALYQGSADVEQVLAAAIDEDPLKQLENECVAYFFLGQYRLINGDYAGAAEFFRKTLATGMTSYRQFAAAEEELRRLGMQR